MAKVMLTMGGRVQVSVPSMLGRSGSFRLLFAGQALSVVGDRITPIAIAFAVLDLGDASDLGLVLAAAGVPFALFAIAGGGVSDRVGRRPVMIAADVVRALVQALTAALLLTGSAEVWMLVALSAVFGTCSAVFMPALMGLIPQAVPPDRLQEANALIGFTRSVANVAGPVLAGVVIAVGGAAEAIALDALTFAVSAACLTAMGSLAVRAPDQEEDDAFLARLRVGWREVRARPWLTYGLGAMAAYHVFVLPGVFVLGPAMAQSDLSGASSWAAIVACFGVGHVAGNVVALRVPVARPVLVAALALVVGSTQGLILGSGLGTAGIAALEGVTGVAVALFFTLWDTSIQEQVPARAISRVSSYDFTVSLGLTPIGMAVAGPVAAAVGLHATLVGLGVLGMLAALAWLAVPDVRGVRRAGAPPAAGTIGEAPVPPEAGVGAADGARFARTLRVEER